MEMMLWNALLTIVVSFVGWVLKSKSDELQRIQILVNRTREEIAKEYVTKSELHTDINRVLDRLDRLESKIDRMIESNRA
jgi:hypothetical protein